MKKLLIIPLLAMACDPVDLRTKATQNILAADQALCKRAVEIGFNHAIMENAAEGFVKLNNGSFPIVGKLDYSEKMMGKEDTKTITWAPEDAAAAKAGDMGYSWGNWKFITPDTTYYGNYVTVWKKDIDGKWRILVDAGTDSPKPKTER